MAVDLEQIGVPWAAEVDQLRRMPGRRCERCNGAIPQRCRSRVRFCGKKCAASYRADKTRKPRGTCPECGKTMGRHNGRGCSMYCSIRLRRKATGKLRTCPVCKKEHFPKGNIRLKYCSRRCYNVVRADYWTRVEVKCFGCGVIFLRAKGVLKRAKRPFCNRECIRKWHTGVNHVAYRGDCDPNRGRNWMRLAESIRKLDGYCCRRCGKTQEENKRRLEVDHIKPWRSFTNKEEANQVSNLASLCGKCHRYKTAVIERDWLRGDVLRMLQYQQAVRREAA